MEQSYYNVPVCVTLFSRNSKPRAGKSGFRPVRFLFISKLTFVVVERAKSRVDQSELEMLERRLQVTDNLENQTQSQVYLVGPAVDGVNVQQLLERFSRPD